MKDGGEMKCLWFYTRSLCSVSAASFMSVLMKLSMHVEENSILLSCCVFTDRLTLIKLKLIFSHMATSACDTANMSAVIIQVCIVRQTHAGCHMLSSLSGGKYSHLQMRCIILMLNCLYFEIKMFKCGDLCRFLFIYVYLCCLCFV